MIQKAQPLKKIFTNLAFNEDSGAERELSRTQHNFIPWQSNNSWHHDKIIHQNWIRDHRGMQLGSAGKSFRWNLLHDQTVTTLKFSILSSCAMEKRDGLHCGTYQLTKWPFYRFKNCSVWNANFLWDIEEWEAVSVVLSMALMEEVHGCRLSIASSSQ